MPGGDGLAADLGVGVNTVEAALQQLESEGLLINQGRRRGRLIQLPEGGITRAVLRVAVLVTEIEDFNENFIASLPHELEQAGHLPVNPGKSMRDLGMDVGRIGRLVRKTPADAWVVVGGSRELLEWFSAQEVPAFALFGRRTGLPIAMRCGKLCSGFALALLPQGRLGTVMDRHHRRKNGGLPGGETAV